VTLSPSVWKVDCQQCHCSLYGFFSRQQKAPVGKIDPQLGRRQRWTKELETYLVRKMGSLAFFFLLPKCVPISRTTRVKSQNVAQIDFDFCCCCCCFNNQSGFFPTMKTQIKTIIFANCNKHFSNPLPHTCPWSHWGSSVQ
jgi:hypothetical protein